MTKNEIRKYVMHCCKTILENGSNDWLWEVPERDRNKVQDEFQKLLKNLGDKCKNMQGLIEKIGKQIMEEQHEND